MSNTGNQATYFIKQGTQATYLYAVKSPGSYQAQNKAIMNDYKE